MLKALIAACERAGLLPGDYDCVSCKTRRGSVATRALGATAN